MKSVKVKSPAKINLFLEVTGLRDDGYHLIETIFAKIDLSDSILAKRLGKKGAVRLHVRNFSGCKTLSTGPGNLVSKAAVAFRKEFGISEGIDITLEKNIPVGSGLGGGSSDAASTLIALSWIFNIGPSDKRISKIAGKLGADVPFFMSEAAVCVGKGVGERISPLKVKGSLPWIVLVCPGEPVLTAVAYKRLAMPDRKSILTSRSSLHKLKTGLEKGLGLSKWGGHLFNRLESAVLPFHPSANRIRKRFQASGAQAVLMSGSGSCVFALAPSYEKARALVSGVGRRSGKIFLTRFFSS